MTVFLAGHATHPDANLALALVGAQIEAQRAAQPAPFTPTLGWLYFTDAFARQASALLAQAQQRWPQVSWVGGVGVGIAANGVEYLDEPALSLMLCNLPQGQFGVFNGRQALRMAEWHTALVHADPNTLELPDLIAELAQRTTSGHVFGGLLSSRHGMAHLANGVFEGGLSGVAFSSQVALVSRVTQGCQPFGPSQRVSAAHDNVVLGLNGEPALPQLLQALGVSLNDPERAMPALRATLVGLTNEGDTALSHGGQFGVDTRVRHLIGLDPARQGLAIGDTVTTGQQLAFCRRDMASARRDLTRICAEIREEADGDALTATPARRIAGAIYVSCNGRGGAHFGGPSAELLQLQHALGDVPLVGFFAAGEIAHHHLYSYTGVLTVFLSG